MKGMGEGSAVGRRIDETIVPFLPDRQVGRLVGLRGRAEVGSSKIELEREEQ